MVTDWTQCLEEWRKWRWIPDSKEIEQVGLGDYWMWKARNMKSRMRSFSVKQSRTAPLTSFLLVSRVYSESALVLAAFSYSLRLSSSHSTLPASGWISFPPKKGPPHYLEILARAPNSSFHLISSALQVRVQLVLRNSPGQHVVVQHQQANSNDDYMSQAYLLHLWSHLHAHLCNHSPRSSHSLTDGDSQSALRLQALLQRKGIPVLVVMWKESNSTQECRVGLDGLSCPFQRDGQTATFVSQCPLWLPVLCTSLLDQ